eukprot:CAMPEP_0117012380 /NCGR_PEP_ID=MMETSP0472-20121206/10430_1 /TAXON_ID=693140 ORGANISM="Tiarina fusus, Strain LIS" /NCGR_SAMPLE_ID=MMETSP0472 /ASSEMBLY_ACC=CAM_ASM_000603 /LENGTH=87 /DNA_ID=CAMNT_0004715431 /DNA_START=206 /DNA_END=469 /DNA_ORIENTATION=-
MDGIIGVGAVDMTNDEQKPVGEPFNVKGFPTIKFFSTDKSSPLDYDGGRSAQDLISYAFDQIKDVANSRMGSGGRSSGGGQKNQQCI